jgi:VanZ like family.
MYFISSITIATIIYAFILGILFLSNKRRKFPLLKMLPEYVLIIYSITILKITGIIGMSFHYSYFLHSLGFNIPFEGSSIPMLILNLLLFVPIGFLFPIALKSKRWNYMNITLVGFCFSFIIEFLQMFAGRMSEIDDLLMNIVGTIIGYTLYKILTICFIRRQKENTNLLNKIDLD